LAEAPRLKCSLPEGKTWQDLLSKYFVQAGKKIYVEWSVNEKSAFVHLCHTRQNANRAGAVGWASPTISKRFSRPKSSSGFN